MGRIDEPSTPPMRRARNLTWRGALRGHLLAGCRDYFDRMPNLNIALSEETRLDSVFIERADMFSTSTPLGRQGGCAFLQGDSGAEP